MGVRVSIGDFAVMTSLSRKALRHYHDVGILEPTHIDPSTGYRFYDTGQVDHAHIIRRFRSLGMSIPDIKALLSTDDAGARTDIITTHLAQMEAQLQQTRETVGALRELLAPVRAPADITSRHEPALAVWSVSATVDTAGIDDWFSASLRTLHAAVAVAAGEPTAVVPGGLYDRSLFLEERGRATMFVAAPPSADPPEGIDAEVLPSAEFAVLIHPGGHDGIDRSYRGPGDLRERASDQQPGAHPRALPRRHPHRSSSVHRHRDLLADLQHHGAVAMNASITTKALADLAIYQGLQLVAGAGFEPATFGL